jgi:hypothetical protein
MLANILLPVYDVESGAPETNHKTQNKAHVGREDLSALLLYRSMLSISVVFVAVQSKVYAVVVLSWPGGLFYVVYSIWATPRCMRLQLGATPSARHCCWTTRRRWML